MGGASGKLERDVFRQCFFYTCAFYISWPILFSVYLASVDVKGPFGLTLTVAFVAPLQGFNNFLVYLRPKVNRYLRQSGIWTRMSHMIEQYASITDHVSSCEIEFDE